METVTYFQIGVSILGLSFITCMGIYFIKDAQHTVFKEEWDRKQVLLGVGILLFVLFIIIGIVLTHIGVLTS